jgi:hypothetical protein
MTACLINPAARLAAARALDETTATRSLAVTPGLDAAKRQGNLRGTALAGRGAAFGRGGILTRQRPERWDAGALRREFMRGVGTAFDNRNAGSYFVRPRVSFVLISGLSYNTTFNRELWISSFPL